MVANNNIHRSKDDITYNARVRYLPDDNGVYRPYELITFEKRTFCPKGWEASDKGKKEPLLSKSDEIVLSDAEIGIDSKAENKRKSFCRARNRLFDISMSTLEFDCFVTLTLDAKKIDRYDYDVIIKKLSQWLGNRVRRNGLTYVLVPEYHKDRAIHFHGLANFSALKVSRAYNAHRGTPSFDDAGRPVYNLADFPFGFTTVIPLSGENARQATAKYCYKYITKSGGEMVGGRYYLSGGALGYPRYEYLNLDFDSAPGAVYEIGDANIRIKKYKTAPDFDLSELVRE